MIRRLVMICAALGLVLASLLVFGSARAGGGELDPAFGNGGLVEQGWEANIPHIVSAVAIQPDGKILAGGTSEYFARLVRFSSDGSLDTSFGQNGSVLSAQRATQVSGIAVQSDGKIVTAGSILHTGPNADFLITRYNSDGSLDSSFGSNGEKTIDSQALDASYAVALQSDGKIIIAGRTAEYNRTFPVYRPVLLRLNSDGSLDDSFNAHQNTALIGTFTSLVLQAGGKVVAAGRIIASGDMGDLYEFSLLRFNGDGSNDATFGTNGLAQTTFSSGSNACGSANGVTSGADGKLIATGYATVCGSPGYIEPSSGFSGVLARFNEDGSVDSTFGTAGKLVGMGAITTPEALVRQPNGKIVVVGDAGGVASVFALFRANADGSVDETFGDGGVFTAPFAGGGLALALAVQPDGKVVAAGKTPADGNTRFALLRLSAPPAATPTSGPGCSFSDVCADDYFGAAVANLVGRGVISGYGNNTFRPYANATRGQVAKIVVLATGLTASTDPAPSFSDVPASNPFATFIAIAAQHEVISGYADGTFKPFNDVTRGQLAKIVVGAAGWPLLDPATPSFRDVSRSNNFYKYIETAVEHGIISGYGDETFKPYNNATRGQIAKIVYLAAPTGPTTPTPAAARPQKAGSK